MHPRQKNTLFGNRNLKFQQKYRQPSTIPCLSEEQKLTRNSPLMHQMQFLSLISHKLLFFPNGKLNLIQFRPHFTTTFLWDLDIHNDFGPTLWHSE